MNRSAARGCIGALVAVAAMLGIAAATPGDMPMLGPGVSQAPHDSELVTDHDLRFTVAPLATPVHPGKTPLLIGVENRSKYPLRLSLRDDRLVTHFRYDLRDKTTGYRHGGGDGWAVSHDLAPGFSFCHEAKDLIVVPPGGTVFRGAEVDLERADPGPATLTVKVRLLEVPAHLGCAPARLFFGEASDAIDIIENDKPPPPAHK